MNGYCVPQIQYVCEKEGKRSFTETEDGTGRVDKGNNDGEEGQRQKRS